MNIQVNHPILLINLPITKKEIVMRVMTIKEEKILLTAQSSKNQMELLHAMMVCLNNCMVESNNVDLYKIPFYELQYIFLHLRSASVNKITKLLIQDEYNKIKKHEVTIDITNVNFITNNNEMLVMFSHNEGLEMMYPTFDTVKKMLLFDDPIEKTIEFLKHCIRKIFTENSVYNTNTMTTEELTNYIESLPASYFENLKQFIDNLPKITYEIEYTNTKGEYRKIVLDDLENFI
jgi:hypothetical protein